MKDILLVEDDPSFGYILSEYLKMKGYAVQWEKEGHTALKRLKQQPFDLAVLDVMLPDWTGFELAVSVKEIAPRLPFIFLTARDFKIDQLKGYQLGADEYITKPIDEEVLVAKVEVILGRHKQQAPANCLQWKSVQLFYNEQLLEVGGKRFSLSSRENDLLKMLLEQQGKLVSRQLLLSTLWGATDEFSRKSMDVFISRLRKYLKEGGQLQIRNVHGKGFILE